MPVASTPLPHLAPLDPQPDELTPEQQERLASSEHHKSFPPKNRIRSAEHMNFLIEEYFSHCDKEQEPYTMTGLTLSLGFCDRSSFFAYMKQEKYTYILRKARTRIGHFIEKKLYAPKGEYNTATLIFALKNIDGWRDTQEIEISHDIMTNQVAVEEIDSIILDGLSPEKRRAAEKEASKAFAKKEAKKLEDKKVKPVRKKRAKKTIKVQAAPKAPMRNVTGTSK